MSAAALVLNAFRGWNQVEKMSPDIAVVDCWDPTGVEWANLRSDYKVEVIAMLKGTNTTKSTRLLTNHELQKGGMYLVLGEYNDQGLCALEDYRVIQLDKSFNLESLGGKTLDEKLQILFHSGLEEMKQKIQDDEEEKDRLEQALQK